MYTCIGGWRKFHAEHICFLIVFLVIKNSFKKLSWPVLSSFYYWELRKRYAPRLLLISLGALEEKFSRFSGTDWEGSNRNLLPLVKLYEKVWIWNWDENLTMALLIVAVCTVILKAYKVREIFPSKCLKRDFQDFEKV